MLKPASWAPQIRLLAPSGVPLDHAVARRGVERLRALGCEVQGSEVLDRQMQRFAGTDAERRHDINQLAELETLPDLGLMLRGGYGASRLLADLNYAALGERLQQPLPLVGYSDFTALQMALYSQSGVITLAGPMLPDLGAARPSELSWSHFWAALSRPEIEIRWQSRQADALPGSLHGPLWGGNLAMLCSLLGSPYFPRIDDGLLFIEDVGEAPYRVERMLYQLLLSGVIGRQQAVILGDFTDCSSGPRDSGYDLGEALAQFRRHCPVPVLDGLPFGHGRDKTTLPFGAQAWLRQDGAQTVLGFRGQPRLSHAFEPELPPASTSSDPAELPQTR